jgi:hypothetical protein
MEKRLNIQELTQLVDILTAIYQEGKAESNDMIVALVRDALDVLSDTE